MANNSIISNLEPATAISEIRLLLNSPLHRDKTFILLEGDDDIKLFYTLLSKKTVLIKSYGSCVAIDMILSKFFKNNKNIIGIRDKDYQQRKANNKIFYCDFSCIEAMIISQDSCMEKLALHFYHGIKNHVELRQHILERIVYLSYLRLVSSRKLWKISFDGIKPGKCYSTNISDMNSNILNELIMQNPNRIKEKHKKFVDQLYNKNLSLNEMLEIINGHDFMNLFVALCRFESNNRNLSIDSCHIALMCSFGKLEFKNTNLYNELTSYQIQEHLNIVE